MYPATINAQEVIGLFERMMQRDSQKRMLLLKGEEKMGKTHLLGSDGVFSILASQKPYYAYRIFCDLKLQGQTDEEILRTACIDLFNEMMKPPRLIQRLQKFISPARELATDLFPSYYPASQPRHSDTRIVLENNSLEESTLNATMIIQNDKNDYQRRLDDLAYRFVKDIHRLKLSNRMIVFFVDDIDFEDVPAQRQTWIMNTLLIPLATA